MLRNIFYFLHGQKPHPLDVISVYFLGLLSGLIVLYSRQPLTIDDWVLAFLAADITGGIISNATISTRLQWQRQRKLIRHLFIVTHLIIHPIIIFLLNGLTNVLSVCLIVGLITKVLLFLAGSKQQ